MNNYKLIKQYNNTNIEEETRTIITADNINEAEEIVKEMGGQILESSETYKYVTIRG